MDLKDVFLELYIHISTNEATKIHVDCHSLSYMDVTYLDIIFFNDGCTPSFIAEQLGIARSAVTVRLNKLEKEGWVEKIRDEKDCRLLRLTLTEQSRAEYQPLLNMFATFQDRIEKRFSDDESKLVADAIHRAITDQ